MNAPVAIKCDVDQARDIAAKWHEQDDAKALIAAIVGLHRLCRSLPHHAHPHIGHVESRYVRSGLVGRRDFRLVPVNGAVALAWAALEEVRADALRRALRTASLMFNSPEYWDLELDLDDLACGVSHAVSDALDAAECEE